ncbi:MAG: uroporphyrinogen-III C-methyltransferase [Cytophagales bacterium]
MENFHQGIVMIVGAGPGAPDLLTLKGLRCLENAEVVLHDTLISKEILDYCKPECVFWDVGKKYGDKSMSQTEINQKLVEAAFQFKQVVRLKGGDPSIFGRLKEEIDVLEEHQIKYEIVPGISSSIGVLTDNLIPVTTRGINESFIVSTAAKPIEELEADVISCISNGATLVLLMSMSKLELISGLFSKNGNDSLHAVIIQEGTLKNQKKVFCSVAELNATASRFGLKNPAIVAIGEVVKLGLL